MMKYTPYILFLALFQLHGLEWVQPPTVARNPTEISAMVPNPQSDFQFPPKELALNWIQNQQESDGSWPSGNDTETTPASPHLTEHEWKIYNTAHALLVFFQYELTHRETSPYQDTVRNGLAYLLEQAQRHPQFGTANLQAMIPATHALTEAYAMYLEPELRSPAKRAMKRLYWSGIHGTGGWESGVVGWPSRIGEDLIDLPTTWQVLEVIASYRSAGIDHVETGLAIEWFKQLMAKARQSYPGDVLPLPLKADRELTYFEGKGTAHGLAMGAFWDTLG